MDTSHGDQPAVVEIDGDWIAYLANNAAVIEIENGRMDDYLLVDPASPEAVVVLGSAVEIRFSLDGRFLALIADLGVTVLEIPSGEEILTAEFDRAEFAPDGEYLAVVNTEGVSIYELPSGDLKVTDPLSKGHRPRVLWNYGDALVAYDSSDYSSLITTGGEITNLSQTETLRLASYSSHDLLLFGEDFDVPPSFFDGETRETLPTLDAQVFDGEWGPQFIDVIDPSSEWYSELLGVGAEGNQVVRFTSEGLVEAVVASPGLFISQAVRVDDTNYYLFRSETEVEVYSEKGDRVSAIYSGQSPGASLTWSDGHLFLELSNGDTGMYDRVITLLSISPDQVQTIDHSEVADQHRLELWPS